MANKQVNETQQAATSALASAPTAPSQPLTDYSGETIQNPQPINTPTTNSQEQTSQTNTTDDQSADSTAKINKKIKFWKRLSIILGLIALLVILF